MVCADLIGGLGNNMFQYVIARTIADAKKYNLHINNIENLQQYFSNVCNISERSNVEDNTLNVGYNSCSKTVQYFDVSEALQHQGKISFSGFFQKSDFYKDQIVAARNIFNYDESNFEKPSENDIVLHVRLGDYVALNWFLHPEIFISIIERCKITYDKCFIVTDEPHNPMLHAFSKLENVYLKSQSLLKDFTFLKNAKRLIISQSTFGWWGAVLGNADQVFVPLTRNYHHPWKINPGLDDIDLVLSNDRFTKVFV
jgi:hypothetical protein